MAVATWSVVSCELCQPRTKADGKPITESNLRAAGVILTYDPGQQTLRCNEDITVTIGNGR